MTVFWQILLDSVDTSVVSVSNINIPREKSTVALKAQCTAAWEKHADRQNTSKGQKHENIWTEWTKHVQHHTKTQANTQVLHVAQNITKQQTSSGVTKNRECVHHFLMSPGNLCCFVTFSVVFCSAAAFLYLIVFSVNAACFFFFSFFLFSYIVPFNKNNSTYIQICTYVTPNPNPDY